jgi:hypothetical protein
MIHFHLVQKMKMSRATLSFPIRFHELRKYNFDFIACGMLKNVSISYVLMSYDALLKSG